MTDHGGDETCHLYNSSSVSNFLTELCSRMVRACDITKLSLIPPICHVIGMNHDISKMNIL